MKLITRDTDYAIRALCYICKHQDGVISVEELVKNLKIPRPFLRKILQTLNKKKLLKSFKGRGGGFKLMCISEKILLVDVIEAFQGPVKLSEHIFKRAICPEVKSCILKKKLDAIEKKVVKELESISIASLCR